MEGDLRKAMEDGQLVPNYQPIVDLATGRPVGFEALLRWTHPELGPVSPGEFIPVAETTGLIIPIGTAVLRQACEDLALWLESCPSSPWVSVNAAAAQFGEEGFPSMVREILGDTGLDPKHLKLEITETTLIQQAEKAGRTLQEVREEGVKLSLDDFGTGYSSLAYLHKFPVDTIKIDRSFVQAMNGSPEGREIPRSIILLANSLEMDVVAEGVETEEQADALKDMGCLQGQGFLWSKAIPASEVPALLEA
jgi:EAL domain-containing protein (putative c-di-GMP-specific phosphodiesterase class I)